MFRYWLKIRVLAALLIGLAASAPAQALTTVSITNYDVGWYNSSGTHSTSNTNMFTGNLGNSGYRNFFAFDLSGVSGRVVSASLQIEANGWYQSSASSVQYTLRDVTTPASALVGGTAGVGGYQDLGNGTVYGSTVVATPGSGNARMPEVNVTLANALDDLTAAAGSQIVLGGSIDTNAYLWGWSNGSGRAVVTLTYDPTVILPIPAPLVLLLSAFGALGWLGRRARA